MSRQLNWIADQLDELVLDPRATPRQQLDARLTAHILRRAASRPARQAIQWFHLGLAGYTLIMGEGSWLGLVWRAFRALIGWPDRRDLRKFSGGDPTGTYLYFHDREATDGRANRTAAAGAS